MSPIVVANLSLSGIGTIYRAELLFLRGVSPWRPAGAVDDLTALVTLAQQLLEANKERHGQVTTGLAGRGNETWVYGRRGAPCRRCGTPVGKHAPDGERVIYWCPNCQR